MTRRARHRAQWERRVARAYHLTPHDVALLWERQAGRCAVCRVDLTTRVWVIDHDHKTNRVRGLLCAWDNHRVVSMIERAGARRAFAAVEYLWPHDLTDLCSERSAPL